MWMIAGVIAAGATLVAALYYGEMIADVLKGFRQESREDSSRRHAGELLSHHRQRQKSRGDDAGAQPKG